MFITKKSLSLRRPVSRAIQSASVSFASVEPKHEAEKKEEKPAQAKKTAPKKPNNDKENGE